jgi:hypothetical protein
VAAGTVPPRIPAMQAVGRMAIPPGRIHAVAANVPHGRWGRRARSDSASCASAIGCEPEMPKRGGVPRQGARRNAG